jgi:hypothetical protein
MTAMKKKSRLKERYRELMVAGNQCGIMVEWASELLD